MIHMPTLTALACDKLQPVEGRRFDVPDDKAPGLFLTVLPSGVKVWTVRFTATGGRRKRLVIGRYPTIAVDKARKLAGTAKNQVAAGIDPQAEKIVSRRTAQAGLKEHLLGAVYESRYLKHCEKTMRPKSITNIKTSFKLVFLPKFKRRPLADITPAEVLAAVEKAGDPQHAFAVGRTFFNWARSKLLIKTSPFDGLKAPTKHKPRDRVLSRDEIRMLWRACDKMDYPFGPAIKLLLLTGARRDEVMHMARSEVDLEKKTWTIPAARVKNGREHLIHLSDAAIEILKSLRTIQSKAGYCFTTTGDSPVSGYSKAKMIVDKQIAKIVDGEAIPAWTFHDLRRTCATGMASVGVNIAVIERALNHIGGVTGGALINTYQHHDFAAERREAFQAWGAHVTKLVA
jgi:integrase